MSAPRLAAGAARAAAAGARRGARRACAARAAARRPGDASAAFSVRAAALEDLPALAALEAAAAPGDAWPAAYVEEELARERADVLVVEFSGASEDAKDAAASSGLAGWAVAWRLPPDELQVLRVAVAPAARRRGAATALLRSLAARGLPAGGAATLEVRAGNAGARMLYAALGYAPVGRRRGYYRDGEDAVLMTLTLPTPAAVADST
jgi:ribosomal protein S18 acetylase RimI-like enzyme